MNPHSGTTVADCSFDTDVAIRNHPGACNDTPQSALDPRAFRPPRVRSGVQRRVFDVLVDGLRDRSLPPDPCAVGRTDSVHLSALATLPDGTKKDITTDSEWSTANSNTATVDSSGTVVGVNAGVTSITASYSGATGSVDCTVGP